MTPPFTQCTVLYKLQRNLDHGDAEMLAKTEEELLETLKQAQTKEELKALMEAAHMPALADAELEAHMGPELNPKWKSVKRLQRVTGFKTSDGRVHSGRKEAEHHENVLTWSKGKSQTGPTRITPNHMKLFRRHFALTKPHAAWVMDTPLKRWNYMERGIVPITQPIANRILNRVQRLAMHLEKKSNWCWACSKNVKQARLNNATSCPYCSKPLKRSMKYRIVPVRELVAKDTFETYQATTNNPNWEK